MYAVLAVPGRYKPIQSVELGEAIPFQAAVSMPPGGMLVGLAVSVRVAVTRDCKVIASTQLGKTVIGQEAKRISSWCKRSGDNEGT